jgi:hypothetical protein
VITRTSEIVPLSIVVSDKGYDSEDNHILVREKLRAFSIIPTRYEMFQYGEHMEDIENR